MDTGEILPVMEEFYSLQGEGFHTGSAAYFLRVGGCDVGCNFCDVKESWNADIHPLLPIDEVVERIVEQKANCVVVTGGEPCLYNLSYLCGQLHKNNISVHLETSGAGKLNAKFDWICFSPKKETLIQREFYEQADELKMIIETEADFAWAEENAAKVNKKALLYLQPEWSKFDAVTSVIVDYILQNPKWKISLQSHKYMRIP
ncbi:MAG: 7-carboxy-7-deazaguanine synthase QueE [Lentimicrobiaceae bacterium]|nr:7-carboxy-7-deazaguanine synthase QueE [Lentimicrobiaceae bacterium]